MSRAPQSSTTRLPRAKSQRPRRFNLLVAASLIISLILIALVVLRVEDNRDSAQGTLAGDSIATFAMFDVGQALSAAVVTSDGYSMVYDFGVSRANIEETVVPFLRDHGVSEIDYAILSHPHQDHLGGLPALIESMPIQLYIDPVLETTNQTYAQSLEMISERNIPVAVARHGDSYTLGAHAEFEILWPVDELLLESDGTNRLNDNSTVVRVDIGETSILLTGDIEREGEEILVETVTESLEVDILQVGHHGSNTSSQDRFLSAADPTLAIISAGLDNRYGHPHSEVMQRLRLHDIQIYRTDIDGTVIIQTDGETWDITTTETDISWNEPPTMQPSNGLSEMNTETSWQFWSSMTPSS